MITLNPLKENSKAVPKGLDIKEYYARIYNWHKKNKAKIFEKLADRSPDDWYIKCYFELVDSLPPVETSSLNDIALVCMEVIAGLMEWAYHEKDSEGVKISDYAHYILDTFFDGFHGEKTRIFASRSKLPSMKKCMEKHKK